MEVTCRGVVRGNTIVLDARPPFLDGQEVSVEVGPIETDLPLGSPLRVLRAVKSPPFVSEEDVAEMERLIEESHLPVDYGPIFYEVEAL